ncbi:uncharacterized protein LOC110974797 [Acanthaster planci]|uniref:Uncharacterized protein LOC110974797 n=1 Tax=Acanthaster planci TaxID=133434 RepID=A0A8B7XQT3_ACAPL|nr:uncharacterized protein LOC110974797 [Acanthaster planci]
MNAKRGRKKEGFLQVKLSSRSALGKAWKRKWVVVQQNTSSTGKSLLLELYMEKGAYHKTVTSLLLEGVVNVQRTTSKTQEHAVEISSASKVLLAVSADSETETQEWLSMFQINLLPPIKELPCPPGINEDFIRVSVIPNKDSERLKLAGDYFAHISLASINLYDTRTGKVALDWNLRHLKKFMLISKCHPLDAEKIVHILPSKRSPQGEGEFIFFSAKGKQLVEDIYERLSNAMTVKSRRSRSTSMLFEITPQELEQMFNAAEQSPEETLPEAEEEDREVKDRTEEEKVNGETALEVPDVEETKANGVKDDLESKEIEPPSDEKKEDETPVEEETENLADGPQQEENKMEHAEDTIEKVEDAKDDDQNECGGSGEDVEVLPLEANSEDVAQQVGDVSVTPEGQDAGVVLSPEDTEEMEMENAGLPEQDEDKANQTNPEEMDECLAADGPSAEEQTTVSVEMVTSGQDDNQVQEAVEANTVEQVESQPVESNPVQEGTPEIVMAETSRAEEVPQATKDEAAVSTEGKPCLDYPGSGIHDKAAVLEPVRGNEACDSKTDDGPSCGQETEQASSITLQEAPETKEDTKGETMNMEQGSGLPEEEAIEEKSNPNTEAVEAEEANAAVRPSSDLKEQAEEKSHIREISPTTEEDATGERPQANVDEQSVRSTERVEDHSPAGLDQVGDGGNVATVEPTETKDSEQVQDNSAGQDLPETGIESTDSSPEPAAQLTVAPASEPAGNPTEEGSREVSVDASNPNHNNSNANLLTRSNTKTAVPLPNTLTLCMVDALRNAQKRQQPTDASPSQQTQTGFPLDQGGADKTSEIIV